MEYYTIKEIMEATNLTFDFINKCIKRLTTFIEPHMVRGENNSRKFDGEGFNLFRNIAQMKEQGLSIRDIEERISRGQTPIKTDQTTEHKPIETVSKGVESGGVNVDGIIYALSQSQRQLQEEKDIRLREQAAYHERILAVEKEKEVLLGAMKFLPEGKKPEQIRKEWEEEQKRKIETAQLVKQLSTLSITQFIQRRRILKRLEELTNL